MRFDSLRCRRRVPFTGVALGAPLRGIVGGPPFVVAFHAGVSVIFFEPECGTAFGAVLRQGVPLADGPFVIATGTDENCSRRYLRRDDGRSMHKE